MWSAGFSWININKILGFRNKFYKAYVVVVVVTIVYNKLTDCGSRIFLSRGTVLFIQHPTLYKHSTFYSYSCNNRLTLPLRLAMFQSV